VESSLPISAREAVMGRPCTIRCAEGESRWTLVVHGMRWRKRLALPLREEAFTKSMVGMMMLLRRSTSTF